MHTKIDLHKIHASQARADRLEEEARRRAARAERRYERAVAREAKDAAKSPHRVGDDVIQHDQEVAK
jgi:hypothetical protein